MRLRYILQSSSGREYLIYRGDAILHNREKHNPITWYFVPVGLEGEIIYANCAKQSFQEAENECLKYDIQFECRIKSFNTTLKNKKYASIQNNN